MQARRPAQDPAGSTANDHDVRTLTVASQKGGVGKSTTATNLATAWAGMGYRVLAIDLDPQFALTRMLGRRPSELPNGSILEVLRGELDAADVAAPIAPNLDLIGARRELVGVELALVGELERERFLARALDGLRGYELVIIDTPPNLGLLTVNGLFATDRVIAPVNMLDPGAMQGVLELRATLTRMRERGIPLELTVVRTMVDPRRLTHRAIEHALAELGLPVAGASIPFRADFNNAIAAGRPLVWHRPDSIGALAYRKLAGELHRVEAIAA
jgi:chromosome partitioning protein